MATPASLSPQLHTDYCGNEPTLCSEKPVINYHPCHKHIQCAPHSVTEILFLDPPDTVLWVPTALGKLIHIILA
jgi:hypothetical protein